jgi:Zn-dependent protease
MIDRLTQQAITHTLHCLTGCAIGEVLGMALGEAFEWSNLWQTIVAIILAFLFGYLLTFYSAAKKGMSKSKAAKTALATDTVSITSMETIDNAFIWIVPGAINATLGNFFSGGV